jgi:hypothetical protein
MEENEPCRLSEAGWNEWHDGKVADEICGMSLCCWASQPLVQARQLVTVHVADAMRVSVSPSRHACRHGSAAAIHC